MADVTIEKINNVHMRVMSSRDIAIEISDEFTFFVEGYKFMPKYKHGLWDGQIRLFDINTRMIYNGLLYKIHKFCKERGYSLDVDPSLTTFNEYTAEQIEDYFNKFVKTNEFELRDYQVNSIVECLNYKRKTLLSPTSSGKSLVIFMIARILNELGLKTLIVATSKGLVEQMKDDFISYTDDELDIHCVYGGKDKHQEADFTVSTWQTAYKMEPEWFDKFDVVIGDEVHTYKAMALKTLMEKTHKSFYKFGFTGTLDDSISNKLSIQGLFGPVVKFVSTMDLVEAGYIARPTVYAIVLEYGKESKDKIKKFKKVDGKWKKATYQEEIDFIIAHQKRNEYLIKMLQKMKGNTLTLFQFVEKHGEILFDMMSDIPETYIIHGGKDLDYRKAAKQAMEDKDNVNLLASYGTFQQGESVKRVHNLVLGSPSKSKIRVLQSLGRGLRMADDKKTVKVVDLVDDLDKNYAVEHFKKRYEYYLKEGFEVKIINVKLEK